jgi:hypothetical protein
VTRATAVMITLYGVGYLGAALAGAEAAAAAQPWHALFLFALSGVLLVAVTREFHHAARALRLLASYRHGQLPGPMRDAIEQATAVPPYCRCETWWTSLGNRHAAGCPARPAVRWQEESP